jgi:hypothetical protein
MFQMQYIDTDEIASICEMQSPTALLLFQNDKKNMQLAVS